MAQHNCNHSNCAASQANASVHQTLSEMDWERGIWNAAFNGEMARVKSLIEKANNAKDIVQSVDRSGYTALHYAARAGHVDICKLLLEYGADINMPTRNALSTPLHKAALAGEIATVNFLICNGACLDAQDSDGQTALHKAAQKGNSEIINALLKACPRLQDITDNKGNPPFDKSNRPE